MEREIKRVKKTTTDRQSSRTGIGNSNSGSNQEWRDWTTLPTDIMITVTDLLLSDDVTHYVRFRGTCTAWRKCTPPKNSALFYFRPKNWIPIKCVRRAKPPSPELTDGFRFVNIFTGKYIWVNIPELNSGFLVIYIVGGCLLLFNPTTGGICLLNPFTRSLAELPPLKSFRKVTKKSYLNVKKVLTDVILLPSSTVVLFFSNLNKIVYAEPGKQHWVPIETDVSCFSALLFKGRLFIVTTTGDLLQLKPNSQNEVRTIVPKYWPRAKHFLVECEGQMFVVYYVGPYGSSHIQIYKFDCRNMGLIRTSIPIGYALVNSGSWERARCIAILTTIFPCMRRDSIYYEYKYYGEKSRYSEGRVDIYMSKSNIPHITIPPLQYWAMAEMPYRRLKFNPCEHYSEEHCLADNLRSYCGNSVMR